MEKFVYQQLADLEEKNWWFRGREKIILTFLDTFFGGRADLRILDVGCGAGSVMRLLAGYGQATGLDNCKSLVDYCRRRGEKVIFGDVANLPFSDNQFDLVVALELLEHVEDDLEALGELCRVVRKGGTLFLSVPAFPFLWGNQDLAAQHKRRYTAGKLRKKLEKSGFSVIKVTYMNFFLFPFVAAFRILRNLFFKQKLRLDSDYFSGIPWISFLLSLILGLESFLFRSCNLPFGVTLLCVAKK